MKMKTLIVAMMVMPASTVFAAALDRSGQSISAFLQSGNYAEVGYSYLDPTVEGSSFGNRVDDLADHYDFVTGAIKMQANDQVSVGFLFDEPFGAAATYHGNNGFVAQGSQPYASSVFGANAPLNSALGISGSTHVDVESRNITSLVGFKPTPAFTIYGGLAYEEVEGKVQLRGSNYGPLSGYNAEVETGGDFGYVAGAAFEIPKIALKASITYRSEIEHQLRTHESLSLGTAAQGLISGINSQLAASPTSAPLVGSTTTQTIGNIGTALNTIQGQLDQVNSGLVAINAALQNSQLPDAQRAALTTQQTTLLGNQRALVAGQTSLTAARAGLTALATPAALPASAQTNTKITSPQSVNLEFQSGIMADTVAFANVRWVDWSAFAVRPPLFSTVTSGLNLVDYSDDQWSANAGVGRKFSDQFAGNFSVGWDSGAGNPVSTLGPTEGYWNVGLGVRYNPVPKLDVSLGAKYFWLGDADAKISSGTVVGQFEDNHAVAYGVKLGYHF